MEPVVFHSRTLIRFPNLVSFGRRPIFALKGMKHFDIKFRENPSRILQIHYEKHTQNKLLLVNVDIIQL